MKWIRLDPVPDLQNWYKLRNREWTVLKYMCKFSSSKFVLQRLLLQKLHSFNIIVSECFDMTHALEFIVLSRNNEIFVLHLKYKDSS